MSRNGKRHINVPKNVNVVYSNNILKITGPLGELNQTIPDEVMINIYNEPSGLNVIAVSPSKDIKLLRSKELKKIKSFWGLYRSLISNMVIGVSQGFKKSVKINGVGWKGSKEKFGKHSLIKFTTGRSHATAYIPPSETNFNFENPTTLDISGINKQMVGQVTSNIRSLRDQDPYKGKGFFVEGEYIIRKETNKK